MSAKENARRGETDRSLTRYLEEIGSIPLINAAEELRLAKRIHEGDEQALHDLTRANLRFVVTIAKQFQGNGLSLAELINEGNVGLIKAAKRFSGTRGFKFITYAVWWIRQAIFEALAEQSNIVRFPQSHVAIVRKIDKKAKQLGQELVREPSPEEIAGALDLKFEEVVVGLNGMKEHASIDEILSEGNDGTFSELLFAANQPSAESILLNQEILGIIDEAISSLTPREAEVIRLHYGLTQQGKFKLEEIGQRYNLTRERIRQIKNRALRALKKKLQGKLPPYLTETSNKNKGKRTL